MTTYILRRSLFCCLSEKFEGEFPETPVNGSSTACFEATQLYLLSSLSRLAKYFPVVVT